MSGKARRDGTVIGFPQPVGDFGALDHQAESIAAEMNGVAVIKPELLDEVTALVEWPVALAGNFGRRFLDVPAEALISTMQDNQRYFPVVDAHGRLLPHFITIANLESSDPAQVRAGNERVIRPTSTATPNSSGTRTASNRWRRGWRR